VILLDARRARLRHRHSADDHARFRRAIWRCIYF